MCVRAAGCDCRVPLQTICAGTTKVIVNAACSLWEQQQLLWQAAIKEQDPGQEVGAPTCPLHYPYLALTNPHCPDLPLLASWSFVVQATLEMYKQLHSHPRTAAVKIVSLPALPTVLELIYAGRH